MVEEQKPEDTPGSGIGCESIRTVSIDADTSGCFMGCESTGRGVEPENT